MLAMLGSAAVTYELKQSQCSLDAQPQTARLTIADGRARRPLGYLWRPPLRGSIVRQTKERRSGFIETHNASSRFGCHLRMVDHATSHWRIDDAFHEEARAHGNRHGDFPGLR